MRKGHLLIGLITASLLGGALVVRQYRGLPPPSPDLESTRIAETGALFRFDREAPAQAPSAPPAALSLTASDGTGLKLVSLDARGVIQGPLAFTEVRLVFENPLERTLEGTFRVTLPQGAAISRFAMKQGDRWQEGEVVEKQAARQAYEDFLHRRQDPALLEQAAGNEFSARVFPIPASGRKELILSYSQELGVDSPYTIPLQGLPVIGRLDAAVSLARDDAPLLDKIHLENAAPDRDLRVDPGKLPPGDGLQAGELALFRVRLPEESAKASLSSVLVLVDTSASRALGFEDQLRRLTEILSGMGTAPVVVAAFDQGIDTIYEGPAAGFAQQGASALRQRQAFGASDLAAALTWAKNKVLRSRLRRVLLVTDGVPTLGSTEPTELRKAAAALKGAGVERIDALAVGGIRDDALLRGLCTAGLPSDGAVLDPNRGAEATLAYLSATPRPTPVQIEGAEWQWPEKIEGVLPGGEALVYAKLRDGIAPKLTVAGKTREVKLEQADRPLLERAWVSAKIQQLVQRPPEGQSKEAVQNEIVQLSTTFRVLSPHTALLVLESESDYTRYKIDRKALADILTLEGTRLVRQKRSEDTVAQAPDLLPVKTATSDGIVLRAPGAPNQLFAGSQKEAKNEQAPTAAPPPAATAAVQALKPAPAGQWGADIGESFGAGGLGLSGIGKGGGGRADDGLGSPGRGGLGDIGTLGHGAGTGTGQGFGSGHGRLGGDHKAVAPKVRMGATMVSGRLPPEVIQRIVRQSFGRFRLCYENGLRSNPNLQGRVVTRFVIDRSGAVASVGNGGSDLPDSSVVSCVIRSFSRLSFPQPEAGIVTVTYPISFSPGDGPSSTASPPATPSPFAEPSPPPPPSPPRPTFGPYEGPLAEVMAALDRKDKEGALKQAVAFWKNAPGDVLALIALGEVFEAMGETRSAARAYGSILDLFSSRADLRRMAGERLERLGVPYAHALAADSYEKAAEQRPDHPSSHRLLAYARLRAGDPEGAFNAIEAGVQRRYPEGRFRGVDRILREDAGLIAAAWRKKSYLKSGEIEQRLQKLGGTLSEKPSVRFVLLWETDNNDVDFHIHDGKGGHAYFSQKELPSGGELYADVTTGYGPECFTVPLAHNNRAYPYKLQAHYYSRGPMGYGMGKLEIIEHDGQGGLTFEERPFVIMKDGAYVDLGTYPASAAPAKDEGKSALPRP